MDLAIVVSHPLGSLFPKDSDECATDCGGGFTASTAFARIVRCFGVKKSLRKLKVIGLPLANIDFRILSKVHFPTSTGIPSNATRRACQYRKRVGVRCAKP